MKNLLLTFSLVFAFNASASIQHVDDSAARPSKAEIARNRACFQQLTNDGCGDPGEDPAHFRSCMSDVFPTLDKDCQALMSKLYSRK